MLKIVNKLFLFFLVILASNAFAANDIDISMAFDPAELALGRRGLLNITVSGTQNTGAPTLPQVDGLTIRPLGTQQSIQMINGKTSMSLTHSFTVMPQRVGEFTLPNFTWEIDGKKYTVPGSVAKLKVLPQGTSTSTGGQDSLAMDLQVSIDKDKVFVGQMLPVTITLYAPVNLPGQVSSAPKIEGNDFISQDYKENSVSANMETINGVKKQVLTYRTYITPLKSGDLTLQYRMGLVVQKPRTAVQNRMSNNFFDSIFGSSIISSTEEIDPTSVPETIKVAALPINGKPKNFTGAIGEFAIESFTITSEEAHVGDPLTLRMTIKGSGNFERISPPTLDTGENWKAYTPKSTFNKDDDSGFTGTKVFEYIIIPQNDKITETPAITFSFFNPQTGRYSELAPQPIALKISEASMSSAGNNGIQGNSQSKSALAQTEPELLPIKLDVGKSVKNLRPLMTRFYFMPLFLGIILLIAGLLVLIKKQLLERKENADYLRRINTEKAIQANLQKVKHAYGKHDAKEFYDAASSVLLEVVAKEHSKSSQSLQVADVINFFKEKGLSEDSIVFIGKLFETADMLKFSGVENKQNLTREDFEKFESLINELEKC